MLRRRGLTLLELLIAIAIVAAMTAIVAPNLLGRLDERRFDSAVDTVSQTLLLARAHAQSTGDVVEVRWVVDDRSPGSDGEVAQSHLEATVLHLDSLDSAAAGASEDVASERPEFSSPADVVAQPDEGIIYEPWARQPLPAGVRLTARKPDWLDDPADGNATSPFAELEQARAADEAPQSLRLAVFLPDGSALVADTRWLFDGEQRTMELTINHWTGLPMLQRVLPTEGRFRAADDEQTGEAEQNPRDELADDRSDRAAQPGDSSDNAGDNESSPNDASDERDNTPRDDEESSP